MMVETSASATAAALWPLGRPAGALSSMSVSSGRGSPIIAGGAGIARRAPGPPPQELDLLPEHLGRVAVEERLDVARRPELSGARVQRAAEHRWAVRGQRHRELEDSAAREG